MLLAFCMPYDSLASDAFDTSFLRSFGADAPNMTLDLQALTQQRALPPGIYPVMVTLNGRPLERTDLQLSAIAYPPGLAPCLSQAQLNSWGIRAPSVETCTAALEALDGASLQMDTTALALNLSIPQAYLHGTGSDLIDEQLWDNGINAGWFNYQASTAQGVRDELGRYAQHDLYLQAGLNVEGWRLRSSSSLTRSPGASSQWQRSNTYAQRDMPRQWGTLTLGEHFTPGTVFNSLPYRGLQLASDMGMLPDTLQGYAPVVRGIAQTQAKVEVRQNGYSLYTTYVPPGPFVIDTLNAAGGSGELEVIVTEADGREQRFVQPYATLGNMLRPGIWRHSVTLGQYLNGDDNATPHFIEATLAYGMPMDMTVYGGVQATDFYEALQGGIGRSLGTFGALSLDLTYAATDHPGQSRDRGESYGWRYGKSFANGTSVRFAGYRYSTQGYRDFSEAVWQQAPTRPSVGTKRNRIEVSISQATRHGSFYLGVLQQTYWNRRTSDQQLLVGMNAHWQGINYGLYANRNLGSDYGGPYQLNLTVSIPLGSRASATYSASARQGEINHGVNVSGPLDTHGNWRYGLDANRSKPGTEAGSLSLNYRSPSLLIGSSVSSGPGYRQAALSTSGSLLVHPDGIAFGQSLGETIALVDTNAVPDIGIQNGPGTRTNANGYALLPYLTPYRRNRIVLDTDHLGMDIDVDNGVLQAIPRRGAVIRARFKVKRSRKIIAVLRLQNGQQPPFGSQVLDHDHNPVGVVGPGGQVLIAVEENTVRLITRWNEQADGSCSIDLAAQLKHASLGDTAQSLVCLPHTEAVGGDSAPALFSQRARS